MSTIARILRWLGSTILKGGFKKITSILKMIHEKGLLETLKTLKGAIIAFFDAMLAGTGTLVIIAEGVKKILGFLGLGVAATTGAVGAKQVFDLTKAVIDPQAQLLDWLSEAFSSLPNIQDIIDSIDTLMYQYTQKWFTPPVTFTYLLQVTGIGEAFNQILQAMIQTLIFIFSVFVVRWAFTQNFTFTKSVSKKP